MTATFESLMAIDARLAAKGEYPLPAFWVEQARRLYSHPTANTVVARCGRGSVKSGFGSRVAFNETIAGDFEIPASEIHYWVDVSENKAEALQRLRQYETWLGALGLPFERRGDEIILPGLRRGFMVRAFQVGKMSGFRAFGWRSDELAKCSADDDAKDRADEVIASARAMTITHVRNRPKGLMLASPVGFLDHHAKCFEMGDTAEQIVCSGASWTCNPSVTEAETHALEPDPRIWKREYAAIPQEAALAALEPEHVERSFRPRSGAILTRGEPVMIWDPSSGRGDTFTACVASVIAPAPFDTTLYRAVRIERDATPGDPIWNTGTTKTIREIGEPPRFLRVGPDGATLKVVDVHEQPMRDEHGAVMRDHEKARRVHPFIRIEAITGIGGKFFGTVSADEIVEQLAAVARSRGVRTVHSDQREELALASIARRHGLRFTSWPWQNEGKTRAVSRLRRWLADDMLSIEEHADMRRQLLGLEEKINPSGFLTYGARRGAHDDFSALMLTLAMVDEGGALPRSSLSRRSPANHHYMT